MRKRNTIKVGNKYSRLTAIKKCPSRNRRTFWLFQCECGIEKVINVGNVYEGKIKSCGCLQKEVSKRAKFIKHGMRKTRFYRTWIAMRRRCIVESEPAYKNYGGRGIKVCKRWERFENYMDDLLPDYIKHCEKNSTKQTTLDRINNDGDYESKNCRWATYKEQANNRRIKKIK